MAEWVRHHRIPRHGRAGDVRQACSLSFGHNASKQVRAQQLPYVRERRRFQTLPRLKRSIGRSHARTVKVIIVKVGF